MKVNNLKLPTTSDQGNESRSDGFKHIIWNSPIFVAGYDSRQNGRELGGLAYTGYVCTDFSCSLVNAGTKSGFRSAYILAHELGHTLGMKHDGDTMYVDLNVIFWSQYVALWPKYIVFLTTLIQVRIHQILWPSLLPYDSLWCWNNRSAMVRVLKDKISWKTGANGKQ